MVKSDKGIWTSQGIHDEIEEIDDLPARSGALAVPETFRPANMSAQRYWSVWIEGARHRVSLAQWERNERWRAQGLLEESTT